MSCYEYCKELTGVLCISNVGYVSTTEMSTGYMRHSHRLTIRVGGAVGIDQREISFPVIEGIRQIELNIYGAIICAELVEADTEEDIAIRVVPIGFIHLDA